MEYKNYNLPAYNLNLIKTNKFKTVHLEVIFREKVKEDSLIMKSMLADLLTDSSAEYPKRRDVVIKLEQLYKMNFYGTASRTGKIVNTIIASDFISPEFIKEDDYYEKVLSFIFSAIVKPNAINKEFESKSFNIVKYRLKKEAEAIQDNPTKLSINNLFQNMDVDSPTAFTLYRQKDIIDKITPEKLYKEYENLLKNNLCDIFIIGNIDFEETKKIIQNNFKLRNIKEDSLELYVENKEKRRITTKFDKGSFIQTNLDLLYNVNNLTDFESKAVVQVFNYILGSGGLTSKLYQKIREQNSMCYGVSSMYLKYDRLLLINLSLDDDNRQKSIKLIKESLKEMEKGMFSDEDLVNAKVNLMMSLDMSNDNNISILNNYVYHIFDKLPSIEERKELIYKVTKEDIKKLSKKIKLNAIYYLQSGGNDGKN